MSNRKFFSSGIAMGCIVPLWFLLMPSAIADIKKGSVPAAEIVVVDAIETVLSILRAEKERLSDDNGRIEEIIDAHILPVFDTDTMSRWVLGKHWRKASTGQQQDFTKFFFNMLRRTYGKQMLQFTDSTVAVVGSKLADRKGYATVDLMVEGGALPNSRQIRYRMRQLEDGSWRIIDASVDGISALVNFRSAIGDIVSSEGLDVLLQRMQKGQSFGVKKEL